MPRPKVISIPLERPRVCAECPLLGKRPKSEVPHGDKYTLKCFLTNHEKFVTGRGSKRPDARFRCKEKEWRKVFATYNGDIHVSATDFSKYQLDRYAWLLERDKNKQ